MTTRRRTEVQVQPVETRTSHAGPEATSPRRDGSGLSRRQQGPHSPEEAEAQYVAARDAWTAAMKGAASGRPSDLAALAIAQEAYEQASAEVERWRSGERVAIPVDGGPRDIGAVVGQELAWRRVHEAEAAAAAPRRGLLARITRRFSRR